MKILEEMLEECIQNKEVLETKLIETQKKRSFFREQGDLKENENYIQATEETEEIANSLIELTKIIEDAEIIKVKKMSKDDLGEKIAIGSCFMLEVKTEGDSLGGRHRIDIEKVSISFNQESNKTTTRGIVILGGESLTDISKGVIACDSPLGLDLLGKTVGTYKTVRMGSEVIFKVSTESGVEE